MRLIVMIEALKPKVIKDRTERLAIRLLLVVLLLAMVPISQSPGIVDEVWHWLKCVSCTIILCSTNILLCYAPILLTALIYASEICLLWSTMPMSTW